MVPIITSYHSFDAHAVCVIKGLGEVEEGGREHGGRIKVISGRGWWMVVENWVGASTGCFKMNH